MAKKPLSGWWRRILKAYAEAGDVAGAQVIFEEMRIAEVEATRGWWRMILDQFVKIDGVLGAQFIFDQMLMCGFMPTSIHWEALLLAYLKAEGPRGATTVFDQMYDVGASPSTRHLQLTIGACNRSNEPITAESVLQQSFPNYELQPELLASLASAYAIEKRRPNLMETYRSQWILESENTVVAFAAFALSNSGSSTEALELIRSARSPSDFARVIECLIALRVSSSEAAFSLRSLFDSMQFTDKELRNAHMRLSVGILSSSMRISKELESHLEALLDAQLAARDVRAVLTEKIGKHRDPWFATMLAFANLFEKKWLIDVTNLLDDPSERETAEKQLMYALAYRRDRKPPSP